MDFLVVLALDKDFFEGEEEDEDDEDDEANESDLT